MIESYFGRYLVIIIIIFPERNLFDENLPYAGSGMAA
jgi:hypothetical protein